LLSGGHNFCNTQCIKDKTIGFNSIEAILLTSGLATPWYITGITLFLKQNQLISHMRLSEFCGTEPR
jgi:hypothetical protein